MLKGNSNQFPLEKYNQSKSVKFSFNDASPPRKGSPADFRQTNKQSKGQSPKPMNQVLQSKVSPRKTIPSHSFGGFSNGDTLKKSPEITQSHTFLHTEPSGFPQAMVGSSSAARLQDLCPEDKQKIGELIKKLASEKDEKERLKKELEDRESHYKGLIHNLAKENEEVMKDSNDLQSQFRYSLNLLKSFQETTAKQQQKIKTQQQMTPEQVYTQQYNQQHMQSGNKNTSFYPQTGQKLTVSFLDNSKEDIRGVGATDENFYREKDGTRRLLSAEPGKTERFLLQERVNQEVRGSGSAKKETAAEVIKREEKTVNEISKLKEDIEYLAQSFKRINFSPAVSPIANVTAITLKEEDFLRSQAPTHEQRIPSPIKLVENFKAESSKKKKKQKQRFTEDYEEQEEYETPKMPSHSSPTYEKQQRVKKNASPKVSKEFVKYEKEHDSSSDEDELAIAEKWLNLRKQKIEKINRELNENRFRNDSPAYDSQQSNSKTNGSRMPPRGSEDSYQEAKPGRGLQGAKMKIKELDDEGKTLQSEWYRGSPSVIRSDGFASASAKKGQVQAQPEQEFFKKRFTSSASKSTAINQQQPNSPGVVNLNQMNVEELIQLKKVLDEKITSEKLRNSLGNSHGSTGKPAEKQITFQSPNSRDASDRQIHTVSSGGKSKRTENYYENQSRVPVRYNEEPQYERRQQQEYREFQRHDVPIDASLMRDFESIGYGIPRNEVMRMAEAYKDHFEDVEPTHEVSRTEEDSLEIDPERLYEEKLKEFLKVRERMLKSKKIKDQGVEIEEILKNTLRESKRNSYLKDPALTVSTQRIRTRNINSPPSIQSLGRPDTAKLSEKDFMLSQDLVKHGLHEGTNLFQGNNRLVLAKNEDDGLFAFTKRLDSEAKTPDYGYGRSQASISKPQESDVEEVEELTDDFYDDKLFDLVDDIEKRESFKPTPIVSQRKSELPTVTSRVRGSEADNEFNSLFNTVRTMFTNREETTTDRIRDKLLHKFDKSDLMLSRLSSDEDVSESRINTQLTIRSERENEARRTSDQGVPRHTQRPSKTDSSIVETDTSVIAINKKIEQMKKNKKLWK